LDLIFHGSRAQLVFFLTMEKIDFKRKGAKLHLKARCSAGGVTVGQGRPERE
jgi:hypothetical protein